MFYCTSGRTFTRPLWNWCAPTHPSHDSIYSSCFWLRLIHLFLEMWLCGLQGQWILRLRLEAACRLTAGNEPLLWIVFVTGEAIGHLGNLLVPTVSIYGSCQAEQLSWRGSQAFFMCQNEMGFVVFFFFYKQQTKADKAALMWKSFNWEYNH